MNQLDARFEWLARHRRGLRVFTILLGGYLSIGLEISPGPRRRHRTYFADTLTEVTRKAYDAECSLAALPPAGTTKEG